MSAKAIGEAQAKTILARNLPPGCPGRENLLVASYRSGALWEDVENGHPFLMTSVREREREENIAPCALARPPANPGEINAPQHASLCATASITWARGCKMDKSEREKAREREIERARESAT